MALPKLNDTPKYELKIPSTGKRVKYRPYLVKEEKILLMASETKDNQQIMNAVIDTIHACVQGDLKNLTTFDLEYIFVNLRAKSVGETSTIGIRCESCEHSNEAMIDLNQVECTKVGKNKVIQLDENVSVEMRYPSYETMALDGDETELGFEVLASCIEAVLTEEERIPLSEEPKESVKEFLESMSNQQFEKVSNFLLDMPVVKYDLKYDCEKCGHHNEVEVRGMQNFF